MRVSLLISLAALGPLGASGCQTAEQQEAPRTQASARPVAAKKAAKPAVSAPKTAEPGVLQATTVLPDGFRREPALATDGGRVTVPGAMLAVSSVARPRAEVRSGPGAQFDLEEFVLEQGTPVVLFDRVGVWQKVLAIGTWQRGWVHSGALAPAEPRKDALTLETRHLPTVLAMRPIDAVKRYPEGTPVKVDIPKGSMFRSLMFNGAVALVMLPETNSVMWVSRKDVQ